VLKIFTFSETPSQILSIFIEKLSHSFFNVTVTVHINVKYVSIKLN